MKPRRIRIGFFLGTSLAMVGAVAALLTHHWFKTQQQLSQDIAAQERYREQQLRDWVESERRSQAWSQERDALYERLEEARTKNGDKLIDWEIQRLEMNIVGHNARMPKLAFKPRGEIDLAAQAKLGWMTQYEEAVTFVQVAAWSALIVGILLTCGCGAKLILRRTTAIKAASGLIAAKRSIHGVRLRSVRWIAGVVEEAKNRQADDVQ